MKSRTGLGALALATSLPLVVVTALIAWRSIERLYTVYLFDRGRTPTDDLTQAHLNLRFEIGVWGFVLGLVLVVSFLLRFWYRSRNSDQEQQA